MTGFKLCTGTPLLILCRGRRANERMSKYSMFREETGEYLVLSSSSTCCHTHSSSAIPTRFSPSLLLLLGVQTQPPQGTGASVLPSARFHADMAPQTRWQHENRAHFTSLRPPRNPNKSFACSGFILAHYARRACSWVIWGELSGQPACVLQASPEPKGYSGVIVSKQGMASEREAHRHKKQHRRMGNGYSPRGLEEEYPVSA